MNTSNKNDDLFVENNIIDLKEILRKYLEYKFWFVGSALIALSIAFFSLRHTPNTYSSSARIKLLTDAEAATIPSIANFTSMAAFDINHENEIEILSSYRLKEALVRQLGLTSSFARMERFKSVAIEKLPFDFEQTINPDSIKSYQAYEVRLTRKNFASIQQTTQKTAMSLKISTPEIKSIRFLLRLSFQNRWWLS